MHVSPVADAEIAAPAARVWEILLDLPGYAAWNPFTYRAAGRLAVGEDVHLDVDLGRLRVHPVERSAPSSRGTSSPGARPSAAGASSAGSAPSAWCRYETEDRIEGPMNRFVRLAFGPEQHRGFRAAADALRARAEATP